jgi:hypothetical protein
MRIALPLIGALAIAVPAAGYGEVYKWVDARGVVNYGNTRPEGVKQVRQLDEDAGRVSTVPGISKEQIARQRQLELEARVERLERELAEQRALAAAAPVYPAYPMNYPAGYAAYPASFPAYGFPLTAVRVAHPRRFHGGFRPPMARPVRR